MYLEVQVNVCVRIKKKKNFHVILLIFLSGFKKQNKKTLPCNIVKLSQWFYFFIQAVQSYMDWSLLFYYLL